MSSRFSCVLIGADTLLMECGDVLLAAGHDVRAVVTSEPRVIQWCATHGVPTVDAKSDYAAALAERPFDYLFAITHLALIPDAVLRLPTELAVNFHDGPLPRYAGLNTPVWALLNRETRHAITWHVISGGVDEGDILLQSSLDIAANETALSLNTRCMAAALETFPEVIRALASRTATRTPQDLSQRTYFSRHQRPTAACMIDWATSTAAIDAFVRALTFGPYPNPVGAPKTCRADAPSQPFVVTGLSVVSASTAPGTRPGTVLECGPGGVVVAAADGKVVITGARAVGGDELPANEIAIALALTPGTMLEGAGGALGAALGESDAAAARHEDFWARRLRSAEPPDVPQASAGTGRSGARSSLAISVPAALETHFGDASADAVLAAFCVYLARTGRTERFTLGLPAAVDERVRGWYAEQVPLSISLEPVATAREAVAAIAAERGRLADRVGYLRDLLLRQPTLAGRGEVPFPVDVTFGSGGAKREPTASILSLDVAADGRAAHLSYDADRLTPVAAATVAKSLATCLEHMAREPDRAWRELDLVSQADQERQLREWNRTETPVAEPMTIHGAFERQADRTPQAVAVVFRGESLTYQELDRRANSLAHHLLADGVTPGTRVGVHLERSLDLLVAVLGVLKAGGAYVPLDPAFPADRVAFMLQDSEARFVVTQAAIASRLPEGTASVVRIDADWPAIVKAGHARPSPKGDPEGLAYVMYTSGSTGSPKGVLIEHRNVANFFTGMDPVVAHDPPGVWLAVTSLSFDISVLELLWTLARGFTVVVYKDANRDASHAPRLGGRGSSRPMQFGLFMWGNDDGPTASKYDLMLGAARYFDENGFDSVWTPERHFHAFGGPFPNPSVTGAAVAAVTKRVAIRSGSCVAPLHHPIRIAEEWAVVDNISNGRVGISFAAGWQPNDFVLRPENYARSKQVMLEQIDVVRRLWRGEKVEFPNPSGQPVAVTTLPRPVQPELPFWVTTAGNPESYRQAGLLGANVLTHLLGQSIDEVAGKIAIYRAARKEAGLDPAAGIVTLMLHTFVGTDDDDVRELVREPMKAYLAASMKLVLGFAWAFPAFKRPGGPDARVDDVDLADLSTEETDAILDFAFDRYFETSGLFGTPETCLRMVEKCKQIQVDEIACLLDFGVDTQLVMSSLPHLKVVRDAANSAPAGAEARHDFAAQVRDNRVTHLQCTPSMARMLLDDVDTRVALAGVRHLMIGGEALPPSLAEELLALGGTTLDNMYGPTETTIWSTTRRVTSVDGPIPIGRPIANTRTYVLDRYRQLLPVGVPGDLYIAGKGVARGYHRRPELTAQRFVPDPFAGDGSLMYWTGDLARLRPDGSLDFLGRGDTQVKIRGYRIELGEIEACLERSGGARTAAVVVRELVPGDPTLVAYVVPRGAGFDESAAKTALRAALPEYMVPGRFVVLREMPLTPNGKIDRKALPTPAATKSPAAGKVRVEPANELERKIASSWCSTLGLGQVGVEENFFDVGGHSLLVVQLHRRLKAIIDQPLSLVDLYRFPTIRSLTAHLTAGPTNGETERTADRASKRREALSARRRPRG